MTPARVVLENARVRALAPGVPRADAVGVVGGRIAAVGRRRDVHATLGHAMSIDCGGRTVIPGLIDPHLHLFGLAASRVELDCARFRRVRDLLGAVARRAATLPAGAWLRGAGLDDARLDRLPSAVELDRAAPRNPVRLRHRSRHASVLNGRGLAMLPRSTRGAAELAGIPTGLVFGVEATVSDVVGRLPARVIEDGLVAIGRDLAALGITTVADATPHRLRDLSSLRRVMAAGAFPLRVVAMRRLGEPAWRPHGRLTCGAVKLMVEEGPDGMHPDPRELRRSVAAAIRAGAQVAVHCVGAATLVAALDAFAAIPSRARRRRHRLEHVAECPPPLVGRIAALGLTVVTNPAFVYWRGDVYRQETGGHTPGWLYRARSLLAAGVPLAGASDAPIVGPSPWIGMAAARRRRTATGAAFGVAEALGARDALALFTSGAARALHADALGRLAPGGPADLAVVEPDPLRTPAAELGATRVWLTLVDGRIVWHA